MREAIVAVLGDFLAKSEHGEGTRGGHIIGHTRSGKAIYGHGVGLGHGKGAVFSIHDAHLPGITVDEGHDHPHVAVPLGHGVQAVFTPEEAEVDGTEPEHYHEGLADYLGGDWHVEDKDGEPLPHHDVDDSIKNHPQVKDYVRAAKQAEASRAMEFAYGD